MPRSHKEVETLLIKLACCLKEMDLWSATSPSPEAFASKVPFAYDTMPLETWLQYIFIPNMERLLKNNSSLPKSMGLLPVAEIQFSNLKNKENLLATINQIDELFND